MGSKREMTDQIDIDTKKTIKKKYKVNNELYSEEDFMKDCPNSDFIPTILPAVKRLIAIGDIHGDLKLAIASFKLANLIDDDYNWIADPAETVVVQVGDQIDSCRPIPQVYDCHRKKYPDDKQDDMNVIDFFNNINKKAMDAGGAVYSLLGNHELMNAEGRFDYVSHDNFVEFNYTDDDDQVYEGPKGRKDAFKTGGPISTMLACTRPSVLVVGSTMFIHAGVLPVLAKRLDHLNIDSDTKLKYLNSVVRKWLLRKLSEKQDKENKQMFVNDLKVSPFWTRIYGTIPENVDIDSNECFTSVKKTLEVFKLGQLVVGHTPQLFTNKTGINGTCYEKDDDTNKLYRVDGGFSKAFKIFDNNDMVQVLEIIDDTIFNIISDKKISRPGIKMEIGRNDRNGRSDGNERTAKDVVKDIAYIYSQNRLSEKMKNNNKKTTKKLAKLIY